ncbi:hypothetical protein LX64_01422 [Chitinophaga skermanii]|uniref:HTH cro/C1-type domain-containing protein n=1 Tax=Chitinophaga skermanii TaxID=331697 RepID=A0A327QYD1_9BACT|nr:hypothetical protein LX64_01422 [Chitinophaga skermanii]
MLPFIDAVRKLADALDTTVGFLLGEANDTNILKDPKMMKRHNEINDLPDKDKEFVYSILDVFLAKSKLQAILK